MVCIFRTACFWILVGSSSRLSTPALLSRSFRLGLFPFNVFYLRDHALHLGERIESPRMFPGRLLQGSHRPLIAQDLCGLEFSDELEVSVLQPTKNVGVDHEGLSALRSLNDERATLLDLLEDVGYLAPGLGHAENFRELQHTFSFLNRFPRLTPRVGYPRSLHPLG